MQLGGVLAMMLSPFVAVDDIPAACNFTQAQDGSAALSVMLEPARPDWRGADAVMQLLGARLDAVVRRNTATEALDVLITAADPEGYRVVLALRETGQALLVRELAEGPAERLVGRCEGGGRMLESWFTG